MADTGLIMLSEAGNAHCAVENSTALLPSHFTKQAMACLLCSFGRKFLLIQGGTQLVICQIIVGCLIATSLGSSGLGTIPGPQASAMIAFICIYIAGFAWSW
jgi:hypothetical protein